MNIFLDANVIADWLLLKNKNIDVRDPILTERYRHMAESFRLVEEILNLEYNVSATSQIAIAEVFGVLYDDAINMKLFREAIPAASWYWISIRDRKTLSEDEAAEIYEGTLRRFDELFSKVEIMDDVIDLEYLGYFILNFGVRPVDAVLLTTAIFNRTTHFATRDVRLIELVKKIDKMDMKVQNPKSVLASLKRWKKRKR